MENSILAWDIYVILLGTSDDNWLCSKYSKRTHNSTVSFGLWLLIYDGSKCRVKRCRRNLQCYWFHVGMNFLHLNRTVFGRRVGWIGQSCQHPSPTDWEMVIQWGDTGDKILTPKALWEDPRTYGQRYPVTGSRGSNKSSKGINAAFLWNN